MSTGVLRDELQTSEMLKEAVADQSVELHLEDPGLLALSASMNEAVDIHVPVRAKPFHRWSEPRPRSERPDAPDDEVVPVTMDRDLPFRHPTEAPPSAEVVASDREHDGASDDGAHLPSLNRNGPKDLVLTLLMPLLEERDDLGHRSR